MRGAPNRPETAPPEMTRRGLAFGLPAAAVLGLARPAAAAGREALAELERRHGGRLGVFAVDTGSGRTLAHRADERFLMCSTFKTLAVAAVLARVDAGRETLARRVSYGQADLLGYAPVARAHLAEGGLPVETLCQAAIEASDNTAANLLLASLGGPAAVTRYARSIGDAVTRLDRREPAANQPAGPLDTTSPRAMAGDLRALLLGAALKPASRERLETWLAASTTGLNRLRAGLPAGWRVGDKTGTGDTQANDVAIVRPPGRPPLIAAAYYDAPATDGPAREAALRAVGAVVADWAG
jgi:beta-lactamase class A